MRSRRNYLSTITLGTLAGVLVFSDGIGNESQRTNDESPDASVNEKLVELQDKYWQLAMAMDVVRIDVLQGYPKPDWLLRNDKEAFQSAYEDLLYGMNSFELDKALATRIDNTRMCYHYDALALYPMKATSNESNIARISSSTLREIRDGDLQKDPFAPLLNLGYIGVYSDFMLISIGPDGKSDILGFKQQANGQYIAFPDTDNDSNLETVSELGLKNLHGEQSYDQEIVIDIDSVYDPTNGILSGGDIVFHRRGGDSFLFSYRSDMTLTPDNFIKRKIPADSLCETTGN